MNVLDLKQSRKEKQMYRLFSLFLKNEAIKTGNVVNDSFYVFLLNLKVDF